MVSQSVWVGIAIGVFFVGIGISYAIFSNTYNPSTMKFRNQEIFDQMMSQNPKMMANWMVHDPKHVEEMATAMRENHDFMMEMMSVMMNDPALRLQMLGHMTENPESMEQMKKMMGQSMMGSEMVSGSMMSNFTSSELQQEKSNLENEFGSCTSDWYITGYFLPIESDYSGELVEISVNEVKQFYLADFLEVVKIEGWGRTNAGNYLGWYHDSYHIGETSLDALGNDLVVGMIAVDTSLIEHGTELIISTLPAPWDNIVFSASDVGPSIIGKHIDVFTGEGINAENETFRITSSNNTVCMQN